jgi:hypothetical protein
MSRAIYRSPAYGHWVGSPRARAPSEVAWRGRAQRNCAARFLRGWRHARARHGAGRESARGQANGSADGYLCARARAGNLSTKMRTVELVE